MVSLTYTGRRANGGVAGYNNVSNQDRPTTSQVCLRKITGYITRTGHGYGLPRVRVRVGIFPPARYPYPRGGLRGFTRVFFFPSSPSLADLHRRHLQVQRSNLPAKNSEEESVQLTAARQLQDPVLQVPAQMMWPRSPVRLTLGYKARTITIHRWPGTITIAITSPCTPLAHAPLLTHQLSHLLRLSIHTLHIHSLKSSSMPRTVTCLPP
jgi:hypothetical protein